MRAAMQIQTGWILFSIAFAITCSLWAGTLARERNRTAWGFMLFALVFPLPTVLVARLMASEPETPWRA